MVEKHNYYENRLYTSNSSKNTDSSCTCPNWQQPSQLLHWLVQLIKKPSSAVKQAASGNNIKLPLILIATNLISVLISGIICVFALNIRYSLYFSWVHIPLPGVLVFSLLLAIVFDFGFSGLLFVSTSIIFKEKTAFSKMLALTGSKTITDSLFLLAGSVFMLFGSLFFFLFTATGNIISFTTLITVYNGESSLPPDKKIYSLSASLALISILMIIIIKAVSPLIIGNIFNPLSLF